MKGNLDLEREPDLPYPRLETCGATAPQARSKIRQVLKLNIR
jgi:hypothetical protein